MDISTIRSQYPQYADMSDFQLANAMHAKFYSDMPVDKVYKALGVGAGYQDSSTGKYVPIVNAGKVADAPTGNAATGVAKGAYNSLMQAGNAITSGAYATLKPHDTMAQASDNFDASQKYLQGNQVGLSGDQNSNTDAAQQATQEAFAKLSGAPQAIYDSGVNKLTALANKLPWANAVNTFANKSPALLAFQNATQTGGDVATNTVLPAAVMEGSKLAGNAVKSAVTPGPVSFETNPVLAARQAGYKLPPSEANLQGAPSLGGRIAEGLSGSAKLRTDSAIDAKTVTNNLAADDLGLNKGTALTSGTFDQLRKPNNAVYAELQDLSKTSGNRTASPQYLEALNNIYDENKSAFGDNPDITEALQRANKQVFSSGDMLKEIKTLRGNAKSNYRASENPQGKNTYALGDLADAQQGIANALEDELGRWVQTIPGKQDLLQRFQQARVNLAKINTYDNAIREGSNDVSASLVARQVNKSPGKFTGNAVKIADMYNNFPRVVVDPKTLGNKTPLNMWESGAGGLTGMAALYLHNPALGAAATGMFLARPTIRAGLLSDRYQNSLAGITPPSNMNPMLYRAILAGLPVGINASNQK